MQCQSCGQDNVAGARFCKTCGQVLSAAPMAAPAPLPAQNAAPPAEQAFVPAPYPAPPPQAPAWSAPSAQASAAPMGSTRVIRKVSPLSVLQVVAVIYGLMFAIFGCLFMVIPGILGAGIIGDLASEAGFGNLGGGTIVVVLLTYVVAILIAGLTAGVSAAIAALLYNLVSRYVGGVEVEIDSLP